MYYEFKVPQKQISQKNQTTCVQIVGMDFAKIFIGGKMF